MARTVRIADERRKTIRYDFVNIFPSCNTGQSSLLLRTAEDTQEKNSRNQVRGWHDHD